MSMGYIGPMSPEGTFASRANIEQVRGEQVSSDSRIREFVSILADKVEVCRVFRDDFSSGDDFRKVVSDKFYLVSMVAGRYRDFRF